MSSVAVVGARRVRQGTGEFVARTFDALGCEVQAIVGTSSESVKKAQATLYERHGIECAGYESLSALLEKGPVDIVAICSPADSHLPLLETAIAAGCHVFCEKPLWWSPELTGSANGFAAVRGQTEQLINSCAGQGRYLAANTQWPFTLPAFRKLHPRAYTDGRLVSNFGMWLSPISHGVDMLIDSGPHLLSMLYALVGRGTIKDIEAAFKGDKDLGTQSRLSLRFGYEHARGKTDVDFELTRCPNVPRPAGYRVNGFAVERHVALPDYVLSFRHEDDQVAVGDPLICSVEDFLRAAESGQPPDRDSLLDGMTQLSELVSATMQKEAP